MKYKAMVLLEELIDHFNPERNYKIYFTLDFKDKCTGEFRKTKERLKKGHTSILTRHNWSEISKVISMNTKRTDKTLSNYSLIYKAMQNTKMRSWQISF